MADDRPSLEKQVAEAVIFRAYIRLAGRMPHTPESIIPHSKSAKLFAALVLFYITQKDKTLDECAWDELVRYWIDEDFCAIRDVFPDRTWPATVAYPNLVAYARYVNGF